MTTTLKNNNAANNDAIVTEVMKSVEAVVTPELSLLRLAYAADTTTRTLMFKTVDIWKNQGIVKIVNNAVDTNRPVAKYEAKMLYQPLEGYELESTLDNIVYDLLAYALRSLKGQIGLGSERTSSRCYDFSFYTKNGALVDTLSSGADPEIIWFEVSGETVLESSAIYRRWRGIVKGSVEF